MQLRKEKFPSQRKEKFPSQRKSKLSPTGDASFKVLHKINDNVYRLNLSFAGVIDEEELNLKSNLFQGGELDGGPLERP